MSGQPLTEAERQRLHNLLLMAALSPFEGERANAIAAAARLAARRGMTLEEAAAAGGPPAADDPPPHDEAQLAAFVHLMDYQIGLAKMRRDAALRAARERGLVTASKPLRRLVRAVRFGRARTDPWRHAHTLLAETSLPFREIAHITGLSIYQVVGVKLKLRPA